MTELQQSCIDFLNNEKGWRDSTSYSQNAERIPTSFTLDVFLAKDNYKIIISCNHVIYRPQWIMHCPSLGIDTKTIGHGSAELAASIAVSVCRQKAYDLFEAFNSITP